MTFKSRIIHGFESRKVCEYVRLGDFSSFIFCFKIHVIVKQTKNDKILRKSVAIMFCFVLHRLIVIQFKNKHLR